ncbi:MULTISPECIES: zinc-ribbon domain-containing protein [unclassified Streptomyces]|uniref:zinc-ribbon domain-containing protein n=1 Tax=unclassified Streptomyces TaxID=2593676 RepID=UPI001BECF5B4|nr:MULTISPECIES: zinc-ribbon domain-containing protein [unclassified Streptomyces]MBT2407548.1 hypothetical protein [Streptomyces sp. ISL-21]MBT2608112.1 hypothetical protein [Streptomyces sp. ISL-87]
MAPVPQPGLDPAKLTAGSHCIVWWQSAGCRSDYRARIHHRVRETTRCLDYCSRRVQYADLATESPDLAAQWHTGPGPGSHGHRGRRPRLPAR